MLRWTIFFLLCALALPALADIEIVGLPDEPSERYDLSWSMTVKGTPDSAFVLGVEVGKTPSQGFHLRWEKGVLSWQPAGGKAAFAPVKALVKLAADTPVRFTIKRRPDTVAVLQDHRLLFVAPAPAYGKGTCEFLRVPAECTVENARCQEMGKPLFGDDFMRPEVLENPSSRSYLPTPDNPWTDDSIWRVAFYRKDDPGADPRDPANGQKMMIPWSLSLFLTPKQTSNGFWYLYRGVGPSWVVANPTTVYPAWDRYFVEAAVKPEYDSEVGLIAAYQDNKNYLQFRWEQREYHGTAKPLAELSAVVNGERKVLATSPRGFEAGQWYGMRINLGWQTAQVLIDGEVLMSAANPGPIEGRVGLYANGAERPRRPKLDDVTAAMYITKDEETNQVVNDAADALRTTSIILFDDVRIGEWNTYRSTALNSPFVISSTGKWKCFGDVSVNADPGSVLTGTALTAYTAATRVRLPNRKASASLLFNMRDDGGYAWTITPGEQKLYAIEANGRRREVDSAKLGLEPGEWADLRAEVDGPYARLFFNNQCVLEAYDEKHIGGRCGLQSTAKEVAFQPLTVTQLEPPRKKKDIQKVFTTDRWLSAWSSPESDWYPVVLPEKLMTPAGMTFDQVGYAAPLPTDKPGLYWHKGGHFHDLRVTLPASAATVKGQTLHLARDYDATGAYRVQFSVDEKGGYLARLLRGAVPVGEYPFTLGTKSQFVFRRLGSFLLLAVQDLDPEDAESEPEVTAERMVFLYRDAAPLKAELIGFTVTEPTLPAAKLDVESDRLEDPFEYAPTNWITESGVWAVMARYSCKPEWNWFGGFGAHTPTVWSKYRLDGDQVVEAYTGIKMQFDNQPEEYARRYRDINMTICADGSHLNSGYTLIRAGKQGGAMATMLLRKGVIVQTTKEAKFLMPPQGQGHRRWFATRMEKRGDTIKVYIDNLLAMTYQDPDPIPGGYAGVWTYNNGIMIGRANLSAEQIGIGLPRAAAPLAVQENLEPLPVPQVTVNKVPVKIATFENGLDDAKERPGLTARIVRERVEVPSLGTNTYLKAVNMYPSGDLSTTLIVTPRDLRATPHLHLDYCFDPGAKLNLYVRRQNVWYEFLLTGSEATEDIRTVGRLKAVADGQWHHLEADLGTMLANFIAEQTKTDPNTVDLTMQEMIVADWSASADVRAYGFGSNFGGTAVRFDNIAFVPAVTSPVEVSWQLPGATVPAWRTALDGASSAPATAQTTNTSVNLTLKDGRFFYHLQARDANGKWMPPVHIPLVVK
ncbi:MAG: hypothetical protein ACYDCO_22775 [Armatimonadota bacterium]